MSFKVDLETFNGPLDLLLYLIRRDEIDIYDIPVAHITKEYMTLIAGIEELNIRSAGDFLVMASTLMEIKSNMMLPRVAARRGREDEEDPRRELLRQLLAYRRYKEAAARLDDMELGQSQRRFHPFDASEVLPPPADPSNDFIKADLWDLVAAYGRLLSSIGREQPMELVADDTPIEAYMARIVERAEAQGRVRFQDLLRGGNRAVLVGLFLALLELMKEYRICAVQEVAFGEIYLIPGPGREAHEASASTHLDPLEQDEAQAQSEPRGQDPTLPQDEAQAQGEPQEQDAALPQDEAWDQTRAQDATENQRTAHDPSAERGAAALDGQAPPPATAAEPETPAAPGDDASRA